MSTIATKRCAICDQDKPQTHFQAISLGRKPMCRLCCYGPLHERKPAAKRSQPRPRDPRPSLPEKPVFVSVNSDGRRVGQAHPRAKLLDSEIDLVFDLRESGMSYSGIADKMGISKSSVAHICKGRRRCQVPERWVQIAPAAPRARSPRTRGRPPARAKPLPMAEVPGGITELQSALRAWR